MCVCGRIWNGARAETNAEYMQAPLKCPVYVEKKMFNQYSKHRTGGGQLYTIMRSLSTIPPAKQPPSWIRFILSNYIVRAARKCPFHVFV